MHHCPLSKHLEELFNRPPDYALTLEELLSRLGSDNNYSMYLILLALPGALPMPAVGLNTLLGPLVCLTGLQMLWGKNQPWYPNKLLNYRLSPRLTKKLLHSLKQLLLKVEAIIKPRLFWINAPLGRILTSVTLCIMGLLMTLPIPGTNTLPSMLILIISVGSIEKDGLLTLLAILSALILTVIYAEALWLMFIWLLPLLVETVTST